MTPEPLFTLGVDYGAKDRTTIALYDPRRRGIDRLLDLAATQLHTEVIAMMRKKGLLPYDSIAWTGRK